MLRGRKNHLNIATLLLPTAGIEPGSPGQQGSALSITPLPLCISNYPNLAEKMFKSSVHVITNRNVIIGNIREIVLIVFV